MARSSKSPKQTEPKVRVKLMGNREAESLTPDDITFLVAAVITRALAARRATGNTWSPPVYKWAMSAKRSPEEDKPVPPIPPCPPDDFFVDLRNFVCPKRCHDTIVRFGPGVKA